MAQTFGFAQTLHGMNLVITTAFQVAMTKAAEGQKDINFGASKQIVVGSIAAFTFDLTGAKKVVRYRHTKQECGTEELRTLPNFSSTTIGGTEQSQTPNTMTSQQAVS